MGEIPARPSQVWVQAGTAMVGMAFLDAYDATGDAFYLDAARKAADALIFGQHPLGGWHYFVTSTRLACRVVTSEARRSSRTATKSTAHYYGNATNDDGSHRMRRSSCCVLHDHARFRHTGAAAEGPRLRAAGPVSERRLAAALSAALRVRARRTA